MVERWSACGSPASGAEKPTSAVLVQRTHRLVPPRSAPVTYPSDPASVAPARVRASSSARSLLSKVPEVTLYFWITKVLCTTVGESAADFPNVNLNFGPT